MFFSRLEGGEHMSLKGLRITKPRLELLESMGIVDVEDLLCHYPYRYEFLLKQMPSLEDERIICDGMIVSNTKIAYRRGLQSKMVFDVKIDDIVYHASIFNRHFMQAKLKAGQVVTIIGKLSNLTSIVCSDLKLGALSDHPTITPIYSVKEGLTSKSMHGYIKKAFEKTEGEIENFIPQTYLEKYRLVSLKEAYRGIHFPESKEDIKHALRHLKYEEFLKFQLMMTYMHSHNHQISGLIKDFSRLEVKNFISSLPFELTEDQSKCCDEILEDLSGQHLMNRLVQGDVGSGKTVVAVIAMYANFLAGYQSALMAPTEILAKQHYRNLCKYFKNEEIKVELLIGSMTQKEKEEVQYRLATGQIDMIVGTHALIQKNVNFSNLGLVIADEQHRFGVKQRESLKQKGNRVDMLVMSATPIPRTLAITLFGDMDVSTIKTMPSGRKIVQTKFHKGKSMKPILGFLKDYLSTGQQCYVVCPLVEESEELDARDAQSIYEAMKSYFKGKYEVGLLHGRMKDDQKEEVMNAFMRNEIQILVSTTVIEVGVDVANANMMVIYNADRFGLSQLHQLRGRVGRGDKQGYCFLLSASDKEPTIERIRFLETSHDGFEISEFDLKLRGPGEVLGEKQSGLPTFVIANLYEDYSILEASRKDAMEIMSHLGAYPKIAAYLQSRLDKKIV